jgi:hypothetical protein
MVLACDVRVSQVQPAALLLVVLFVVGFFGLLVQVADAVGRPSRGAVDAVARSDPRLHAGGYSSGGSVVRVRGGRLRKADECGTAGLGGSHRGSCSLCRREIALRRKIGPRRPCVLYADAVPTKP